MFILVKILLYLISFLILMLVFHIFVALKLRISLEYKGRLEGLGLRVYFIPYLLELRVSGEGRKFDMLIVIAGIPIGLPGSLSGNIGSSSSRDQDRNEEAAGEEKSRKKQGKSRRKSDPDGKDGVDGRQKPREDNDKKSSSSRNNIKNEISAVRAYYKRNSVSLKKLINKLKSVFSGIIRNAFVVEVQELDLLYGDSEAYKTHEIEKILILLQGLGISFTENVNIRFSYTGKALDLQIKLFFYMKLYSILFRLAGVVCEYPEIRRLIKDYGDHRNIGDIAA